MPRPATDKRQRLTAAALDLAYTRGLEATSINDIAAAADVAPGSVYYYFKTRDDVGRAIVDSMLERYEHTLRTWSDIGDPRERLVAFIDMYRAQSPAVAEHGCPVGSLCTQLRKHSSELGEEAAQVLRLIINWCADQFQELGFETEPARARAMHLVTGMQGAATLAAALHEPEALEREAAHLESWIRKIAN